MSTVVDEDFTAFVDARWPDLEAVARVVVLDPDRARSATTAALADLATRWRRTVEEGRPGEEARRALLTAALAAARPARAAGVRLPGRRAAPGPAPAGPAGPPAVPPAVPSALPWEDDEAPDEVVLAVLDVLAASDPLDRALVAARVVWELRSHEVAHLLGRPHGELAGREAALLERVSVVRTEARARAGLGTGGDWRGRDGDLEDAVTEILRGQGDPPDPTALVTQRSGGVRRRHLVLGGVAAATLVGTGAAVGLRADPPPAPARPKPPPGPQDPSWRRTATWSARGPLGRDPRTLALVQSNGPFGSRVLWAGDVGTLRVVIGSYPGPVDMDGTELTVWTGARGQDVRSLQMANLAMSGIYGIDDLVAVSLPDGPSESPSSVLVVLTTPTVPTAEVSRVIEPQPDGSVDRTWSPLPLVDGVAATVLDGPLGPALRVRTAGREQPPASTIAPFAELDGGELTPESLAAGAQRLVSTVTGIPATRMTTTVTVDETLPVRVFAREQGRSRVVVVRTRLPNGTLLTSAAVTDLADDAVENSGAMLFRSAAITPEEHLDDPIVTRVEDLRSNVGRYLVVAPGAERVQLISVSPDGYPVSKVARTNGRDAVVLNLVNADLASSLKVVARDARGRTLFDDVPVEPMWLFGF
ncbi:hypothetical protein [Oryzobacter terrae]|uniref:hypothetical protein n=1 Tax=Oryzobacter terrae TaxID=1620385 RepID=UPI0036710FFE